MSEIFEKFYRDCMERRQREPFLSPKMTCVEAEYILMLERGKVTNIIENTKAVCVKGKCKYYIYNDGWHEVIRKNHRFWN